MTEAEWLVCDNPRELIRSVATWRWHGFYELGRAMGLFRQNVTERRYRLYSCACMRQAWHLIGRPEGRAAVELAEQYVEGEASLGELLAARSRIQEAADSTIIERVLHSLPAELPTRRPATAGIGVTQRDARLAAYSASSEVADLLVSEHLDDLRRPSALLSNVFRDIFGNPFRQATINLAWRTSTAVAIARGMYESRDFSAMPILADALQDAGCDNEDILNHCRDPQQVHVRGCWVVDLVLGKE